MYLIQRIIKTKYLAFLASHIKDYPTPQNLNYFWSYGSLLGLGLCIQIITGIFLSMHYTANIDYAFYSVEHIMRDVSYGYMFRYSHANGASMLFILIYIHLFRGLYFKSYVNNTMLWCSGVILFLLMMGTAFLGYVLPWGQMSLWGATVITNLASAIPFVGQYIVEWLWGGFSVANATLNRFYSFHYVLPFVVLALIILHLAFLHSKGSTNPLGTVMENSKIKFFPFFYVKDLFSFFLFICFFSYFLIYAPNMLGHTDNYIVANPMVTPSHIVPEWYFLPFYAILRSIPDKLIGVIAMLLAILILCIFPILTKTWAKYSNTETLYKFFFWCFFSFFLILGWIGQKTAISPFIEVGQFSTFFYFFLILIFSNSIILKMLTQKIVNLRNFLRKIFS